MKVTGQFGKNALLNAALFVGLTVSLLFCRALPVGAAGENSSYKAPAGTGLIGPYPLRAGKNTIHIRVVGPKAAPKQETAVSGVRVPGYTEEQIRERMQKKYGVKSVLYRTASGLEADEGYIPGGLDVKIPTYFFPADSIKSFTERFQVNSDGKLSEIKAQKQTSTAVNEPSGKIAEPSNVLRTAMPAESSAPVKEPPKYKDITIQVRVHSASPFRLPRAGDFFWFANDKGRYIVPLLRALPQDPLKGFPAQGPMLIRNRSAHEILAVTVDDPADVYYYKNTDTLPVFGKTVPIYTETRKTASGREANIQYIRYFREGVYCLVVRGDITDGERSYGVAAVFPESEQYEYLPQVLYVIENIKGQK